MRTLVRLFALLVVVATGAGAQTAPVRNQVRADDGHMLTLWSKRPAGTPTGAILLLHGRTWSALPNFDLQVKGTQVSLMDALVARGYAVYALDQRGYGATSRDASGWLTPRRAEMDAVESLDWIAAALNGARPALLGYSRGSQTALLTAQLHPAKMSGLVLYAFPYDITAARQAIPEPAKPPREKTTAAGAAEDFLTPESTPAGVKDAYVNAATTSDPVRVDWRREEQFHVLDPSQIRVPTLLINGDRDPYAAAASLGEFYSRLTTVDRWWVVLANADHVAHLEQQAQFVQALVSFMERNGKGR
ncbi:MAG: hydrolase [Gemmatimonadetes bacterium]|nr:hydrolase [Gemmatimonadota bacterium]